MSRITPINPATAAVAARPLLDAVQAQLGVTPNFIRVLANAPKALEGFSACTALRGAFTLDKATQERIALAVAEGNACEYCVSAHTAIGRRAGLSNEEMLLNRRGSAGSSHSAAAVALARALNDNVGDITDQQFAVARAAGLGDAEVVEIIALVALNLFTNLIGKATQVDIDFPRVPLLHAA